MENVLYFYIVFKVFFCRVFCLAAEKCGLVSGRWTIYLYLCMGYERNAAFDICPPIRYTCFYSKNKFILDICVLLYV